MTAFSLESLRLLNEAITSASDVEKGRIEAANAILAIRGHNVTINRHEDALTVLRQLEEELMECGDYRYVLTFLLGPHQFNAEPETVKRIFKALHGDQHQLLLMGSTSSSKTYSAAAWHYADWRRWPWGTSVKVAALNEKHLRDNVFSHIVDFHKAANDIVPMRDKVRVTDLFLGLEEAGDGVGFSGIAFKGGDRGSGAFKGYHPKPVRFGHPVFGRFTRLRILGDECVRGDQRVSLGDGSLMTIKEMVESKYSGDVLCYNTVTGAVERKRVIGWHKNPLRGRSIVDIRGLKVTEDHPVYTEHGYIEAAKAKCAGLSSLTIQYEDLSSLAATNPNSAITRNWQPTWRRINSEEQGSAGACESMLHSWSGATGIYPVEARDSGELLHRQGVWPPSDGVRGACLQVLHQQPSELHGDSLSHLSKRGEGEADNASVLGDAGRLGAGGLVHGRWVDGQERKHPEREDFNVCLQAGGFGVRNLQAVPYGDVVSSWAEQGGSHHTLQLRGNEGAYPQDWATDASRPALQARWASVPGEAGCYPDSSPVPNDALQDLRNGIHTGSQSADVLPRMQQGELPPTGNEGVAEGESVYCIDVESNHNFFCEGVLIHNCQEWSGGPFADFGSTLSAIDHRGTIKATLCFNPVDTSCPVVQRAEPEEGWNEDQIETLYDYESKMGWQVLRIDAARLENVVQRKEVYRGFQTFEGYCKIMKEAGDNGEKYYWACRGIPPMTSADRCVIPTSHVSLARATPNFIADVETFMCCDLAGTGQDKAPAAVFKFGLCNGYETAGGDFRQFRNRVNEQIESRHVLHLESILYLEKSSEHVSMCQHIMGLASTLGIPPENVAVDATALGGHEVASWLKRNWGDILAVDWGTKATEAKISAEDMKPANQLYDLITSEMWFTVRSWIRPEVRALMISPIVPPSPLNTQLTTRRFTHVKKMPSVENKETWKARHQNKSPDEADALVMGPLLLRLRRGFFPGVAEEISPRDMNNGDQPFQKMESVDTGEQLDGVGGGEEHLTES